MLQRFSGILLAVSLLFFSGPRDARASDCVSGTLWGCRSPARLARRYDTGAARLAITTEDGAATLLLTGDVIALQLSDRMFRRLDRRFREELDEDDNALAEAIKSAVFASVRSMLDHSAVCPVRDVESVRFRDGRLEIQTTDGRMVLEDAHISDGEETMSSFRERDAVAFVHEFERIKAAQR